MNYTTKSLLARAGGGGSSSSHSSHSSSSSHHSSHSSSSSHTSSSSSSTGGVGVFIFIMVLFGGLFLVFLAFFIYMVKKSIKSPGNTQKVDPEIAKKQKKLAAVDPMWSEDTVNQRIQEVFNLYQTDWSTKNINSMKGYLTNKYLGQMQLIIIAMKNRKRTNKMENANLINVNLVKINDDPSTSAFTAQISASANDSLIDDNNNGVLYTDTSQFTEYWHFVRHNDKWMLDGISQSTEDVSMHSPELQAFADKNSFYFSPDFGWLLLPQRGQLFSEASFKNSDVNNYVTGVYRDVLVEFYDYIPNKMQPNNRYVIAQAAIPKSYGNIVVRRSKSKMFNSKIKGLTKVETEWGDFNKKYDVFASDMERVTSLELLHPVFMEKMEALPFELSIEVVDNVIYLFTKDTTASYDQMMSILKDAFDEMKM